MQRIWAALSVAILAGCGGCGKHGPSAAPDAGTVATADAQADDAGTAELEPHVLARVLSYSSRLIASSKGRVLLDAGTLVYELGDVAPKLLGDAATYGALFQRGDAEASDLGGYDAVSNSYRRISFTDKDEIVASNGVLGFRFTGAAWQKLDPAPPMAGDGEPYDAPIPPALQGHDDSRCKPVRSYGGTTQVVLCHSWRKARSTTLWRHAGEEWTPIVLGAKDDLVESASIAKDDRLWIGLRGVGMLRLEKDALDGEKATKLSLTDAPKALVRSLYDIEDMGSVRGGDPDAIPARGMRYFTSVRIRDGEMDGGVEVADQIVPLPSGEAYVLAREAHGARVLIHLRRASAKGPGHVDAPPIYVGGDADQRAEILNAKPVRGWIGRCPHVLVIAAREKADGSFSADPVFAREKELTDAVQASVKKAKNPKHPVPPSVAIVEGRSGGKRVAGVLVWRTYPDTSEDLVDKLATEMGARFTPNPATPAEATCTPPVLERAKTLTVVPPPIED